MRRLKQTLADRSVFAVVAELTSGPGYSIAPIRKFLAAFKEEGPAALPAGYTLAGIALPQNPGGVSNLDPSDVLAQLGPSGLLDELDVIPHLSCKDHNRDALHSALVGYRQRGIETVLALTGDKPVSAMGVFDLESAGLLQMISKRNRDALLKAKPGQLDRVEQLFPGAAVSPFKYTEPSQMQQYYKMEKKILAGARFLVTQVGWDWRKSVELMTYLDEAKLDVPVIGNVFFLSTTNPAPRLMRDGKLPGCFVSDALFQKLTSESRAQHVERAAQQVAMYRSIGAAGVDLGGVHDFATFRSILARAAEIGEGWTAFKDNLCWPPPENAFYLYDGEGRRATAPAGRPTGHDRRFTFLHRTLLDPERKGFHLLRAALEKAGARKRPDGLAARSFFAMERAMKHTAFKCEDCGDCFLPENFGYCTMGGCAKRLANVPCGDANVDGTCGNAEGVVCRGEHVYLAARASGGLDRLRATVNPPRDPALAHTSSILNYLFGRDHTMKNALISIGEAIHASIPKTGAVMKDLHARGENAYASPSPELAYVRALIEDQAAEGADYIAVNVDAFGESDPQLAADMMVQYVRLVRAWGGTVPVCMDSSDDRVLLAGLKEWYGGGDAVRQPLINSIKAYTADRMMPLKKDYDFAFIGLLVSEDAATGPGGSHSVEELVGLARELFEKAVRIHGFRPEEIFFDSTVFPLAIDMPMSPDVPGYTYRAFETIKAIRSDPSMKGVHFSLGVSNCCRDLPGRRVGICRAYVAKAMEYGLDAGIVNVSHHYGATPPDPGLLALVTAFAEMDGDADKTNTAIELMGRFCDENRK